MGQGPAPTPPSAAEEAYGWFAQDTETGRGGRIVLSLAVTAGLWLWLARASRPLVAAALG